MRVRSLGVIVRLILPHPGNGLFGNPPQDPLPFPKVGKDDPKKEAAMRMFTLLQRDRGATAVEYGVLVGLIIAVLIATIALIGPALLPGFQSVVAGLP
jgi:pilus assembly protein Flp/PilA